MKVAGALNNKNIVRMIEGYFLESAFWIYEVSRVMKENGVFIVVNDNVKFAGVEIPVDLITSYFAEYFGLKTEKIWVLPTGKGNSSQQMGDHGRQELRKCVLVYRKISN
jgi:hypothetical protein